MASTADEEPRRPVPRGHGAPRAGRPETPRDGGRLRLGSSGLYVRASDVANRPTLAQLVTEDACWQFALADWRARRPSAFRIRARRAWGSEGPALEDKRLRLAALAYEQRMLRTRTER